MKNKIVIISSYYKDEEYGLLGPQMAATIIEDNTVYECIVIAVSRDDDKNALRKSLYDYFGSEKPVIAFSTLSGREDLFSFAGELKEEGCLTFLAGPQADADYSGETDWKKYPHRFKGVPDHFNFAIHGPAEQAIPFLNNIGAGHEKIAGALYYRENKLFRNPKNLWDENFLGKVNWNNIYKTDKGGLSPIKVNLGQVLQQIGCPHAARAASVKIDYPASFGKDAPGIEITAKGCSFCDVAADKGFFGELSIETVMKQISCLPETPDGEKIPFELINENPLPRLPSLLKESADRKIFLSQINLILRADYLLKAECYLREALQNASDSGTIILLSSAGFESFDDNLLHNFNKGINTRTNLDAVKLIRSLKEEFPRIWKYSKLDGSIHGFIHPTPWDNEESFAGIQRNIAIYGLEKDILPEHSTPLIIHHSSCLGDWIREIEKKEHVRFKRTGSIIAWWDMEKE